MKEYSKNNAYEYDLHRSGHMFNRRLEIIKGLINNFSGVKEICEIGCGTGLLSYQLSKNFGNLKFIAYDGNKGFIEYANKKYKNKNLKFLLLDIEKSSAKGKYDIIITVDLIHHLRNKKTGILNIKNTLRPNGHWILLEHNIYNLWILLSQAFMRNEGFFVQKKIEKIFLNYFVIINKRYALLIASFIKKPSKWLKSFERKFENRSFLGGYVIYLLKRKT